MSGVIRYLLRVLAGRDLDVADVGRLVLLRRVRRGVWALGGGLLRRVLWLLGRIGVVLLMLLKHAGARVLEVRLWRWKALRSGVGMMLEGGLVLAGVVHRRNGCARRELGVAE